jgi:hypothetical protein
VMRGTCLAGPAVRPARSIDRGAMAGHLHACTGTCLHTLLGWFLKVCLLLLKSLDGKGGIYSKAKCEVSMVYWGPLPYYGVSNGGYCVETCVTGTKLRLCDLHVKILTRQSNIMVNNAFCPSQSYQDRMASLARHRGGTTARYLRLARDSTRLARLVLAMSGTLGSSSASTRRLSSQLQNAKMCVPDGEWVSGCGRAETVCLACRTPVLRHCLCFTWRPSRFKTPTSSSSIARR